MANTHRGRTPRGMKTRQLQSQRVHYLIYTDTKATEENYLTGLKESLPEERKEQIAIVFGKSKTVNLVQALTDKEEKDKLYFEEKWIVLDRDKENNLGKFDEIVKEAEAAGIRVGWSNPCIETWFSAYFGEILSAADSVTCCKRFGELFQRETKQEYKKSHRDIYKLLKEHGDEAAALSRAERRLNTYLNGAEYGTISPSELVSCTTLHWLVQAIMGN